MDNRLKTERAEPRGSPAIEERAAPIHDMAGMSFRNNGRAWRNYFSAVWISIPIPLSGEGMS